MVVPPTADDRGSLAGHLTFRCRRLPSAAEAAGRAAVAGGREHRLPLGVGLLEQGLKDWSSSEV